MNATGCARSSTLDVARAVEVDAPLQPLESRRPAVLVERDDLAVDEERRLEASAPNALERADDRRELRGLLVAEPRPDADTGPAARPGATCTSARMPSYFGS